MKIPPTELIARLRAAQGDAETAQLLEAAANRLEELEAQEPAFYIHSVDMGKSTAPVYPVQEYERWIQDDEHRAKLAAVYRPLYTAPVASQPAQGERQPEEPKWYEKCGNPTYCAMRGECRCGIAYRRHRA